MQRPTLSCDACGKVVPCPDRGSSPAIYTLKGFKDHHVCEHCYVDDARKYPSHVQELAFDVVQASVDASLKKLAAMMQQWDRFEYKSCGVCGGETVMRPGVVACFACRTPFASTGAPAAPPPPPPQPRPPEGGRYATCLKCRETYVETTRTLDTVCGGCR